MSQGLEGEMDALMERINVIAEKCPEVDDVIVELGQALVQRCLEICRDVAGVAPTDETADGALACAETIARMLGNANSAVAAKRAMEGRVQ